MNGIDFFQWLPNIAMAGLAIIIGLAVWMIWRSIAPAAPGISLGYYEVVGRYAGQKLVKRLRGTLVDATALFLSPEIENSFKQLLKEDIKEIEARTREDLSDVYNSLENASLSDVCRIIVTRERLFTKHVLIQHTHVDKPLNAYACYDPQAKFSLGFGFLSQGVITGEIHTFPQPWEIYRLGKVQVHLFKPDVPTDEPAKDPPEYLAKLALYAPATVELKSVIKAKDEQLKEKDRELLRVGKERAANATKVDSLLTAVQAFTTKLSPEELQGRRMDMMDFILLALPTILCYLIADYMKAPPLAGVVLGLLLGAFLMARR